MKTLKYIWRNVTRNKLRSSLTILSVGFSLALMTVLQGYMAMQAAGGEQAKQFNRLVIMNVQGFSGMLPIAYIDKVRAVEGIIDAVPFAWFGGEYQDKQMPFAQFATDPDHVFKVWPEYRIDPEQCKAFQQDRQACVADRALAEKQKWKIGDRITLKGTFYAINPELTLVGVYDADQYTDALWFNWKYFDESLQKANARGSGNCGTIFAKAQNAAVIPDVIKKIDEGFSSSQNPTRTQTESAFFQMFADMLGNVQALIFYIGCAVVFSLSLVAANAMAMSMRERTTEIAVLKAIGFQRGRVLRMILGESCLIAILGGILGISLGCLFLESFHRLNGQMFPVSVTQFAGPWLLVMLLVAGGIGIVSGIVPAIRAAQLSVIDGLRRVV